MKGICEAWTIGYNVKSLDRSTKTMFGTEIYLDIKELFIHAPIPWVLIHMVPIIQTNH